MGRCSSSTYGELALAACRKLMLRETRSYQKLAGDKDHDSAINHAGLGIKGGDAVLDLLKGERL